MSTSDSTGYRKGADSLKASRNSPALVDKFVIRLPEGLRDKIKELSEHNRRSMNSEIIMVLEQYIQQQNALHNDDAVDHSPGQNEQPSGIREPRRLTDEELAEKLESLSADKKQALLSLLT